MATETKHAWPERPNVHTHRRAARGPLNRDARARVRRSVLLGAQQAEFTYVNATALQTSNGIAEILGLRSCIQSDEEHVRPNPVDPPLYRLSR